MSSSSQKLTFVILAFELILLLVAVALAELWGIHDPGQPIRNWFTGNWMMGLVTGALWSIPFLVLVFGVLPRWDGMASFFELVDQQLAPMFSSLNLWQVAAISLAAGVGEEALFRWCLQGALTVSLNLPLALLVASLLFGIAHCISLAYFLLTAIMGAVLGLIYFYLGPVAAISCHAVFDFLAILLMVRRQRGKDARSGLAA